MLKLIYPGTGVICHVDPTGSVPSDTNVDLRLIFVPLDSIMLESPAKGIGVCCMQASVRLDFNGQSLYWYPPPWFARRLHFASTTEPTFQTAPEGIFGSFEPKSPSFANFVVVYTPSPPVE